MSIRNDIVIDWDASPRIITIDVPSTEITMQDLLDTLRWLESRPEAMDDRSIVESAGKENLSGGLKVGLTITLLNALLKFHPREGPDFTLSRVSGGNLVAVDAYGNTMDSPIAPSDYVSVVMANSSSATLQNQPYLEDTLNEIIADIAALNNLSAAEAKIAALVAIETYDPPTKAEMDAGLANIVIDAGAIADAVHDELVEGTITLRQALRLFLSVMTGKSSGSGTETLTFRDIADTKGRFKLTVDGKGNRTAVITRDGS